MRAFRLRRAGFAATLAAGLGLLGVSLHGMAGVDATLRSSATTTTPAPPVEHAHPDFVRSDRHPCQHGHGPEV